MQSEQNETKIVLASSSPRRKDIFSWVFPKYEVLPADIDETPFPQEDPIEYTKRMAYGKMIKNAEISPDSSLLILGSDTTVCFGDLILGKPKSPAHAREMLTLLNGKEHYVVTAVSLLYRDGHSIQILRGTDKTFVQFRSMTIAEVEGFVESGVPMGKAGAYAIQDKAYHPVDSIRGCYTGVMGLPFCLVCEMLRRFGFQTPERPEAQCFQETNFCCPCVPNYKIEQIPFRKG